MTEHQEQCALIKWARARAATAPELKLLYAVPNGGHRNKVVASKLRDEGVLAGMPDICLPVPRAGKGALYIELKAGRGRLSDAQQEKLTMLRAVGNDAVPCWGWQQAAAIIEMYLNVERTVWE
jgi:hypothetical protein